MNTRTRSADIRARLSGHRALARAANLLLVVGIATIAVASRAELEEADRLFQRQDWDAAIAIYETHLDESISDPQEWFRYGYSLHRLGRDESALRAYGRALELGASNPRLFGTAAASAARLQKPEEAIDYLERAVDAGMPVGAIRSNEAFDALRERQDFQNLLARAEAASFPCRNHAESGQFDFWLGRWSVEAGGRQVGTNVIERQLDGCLVFEHYTTPNGYEGVSVNYFDPLIDGWRQIWIDNSGLATLYQGAFEDGEMILQGETSRKNGPPQTMRMTFSQNGDGSVRQLIETLDPESGEWRSSFDGRYVREE